MRAGRLLIVFATAAAGLCGWLAYELAPQAAAPARGTSTAPSAPAPVSIPRVVLDGAMDAGSTGADGIVPSEDASGRTAEIVRSDATTLRSVHGVVRDATTQEPVAGLELSFLSRRPRTLRVVTDSAGRFESSPELAAGAVSVLHIPRGDDPLVSTRRVLEPGLFVLPPVNASDASRELVLLARRPADVLEVAALRPDGKPAQGAAIWLRCGRRASNGTLGALTTAFETADERGIARFGLQRDTIAEGTLCVDALLGDALVSDVTLLEPPLATHLVSLALQPAGSLAARTFDDAGRPVEGVAIEIVRNDPLATPERHTGVTDRAGECALLPLRGGCWTLVYTHPWSGERVERVIDLARGEHASSELHLSLAGLRQGVQGLVLDERDAPLSGVPITIVRAGADPVQLETGVHGEFDYWGRPQEVLWVCAGAGVGDARFDPPALRVPFGTRDVVLRRDAVPPARELAFEIVARADGARLREACVSLTRAAPAAVFTARPSVFLAPDGAAAVSFLAHEELTYVAEARGYRRALGRVDELYRRDPTRVVVRIALEPGFERRVCVRDRATQQSLAGARVLDHGRALGTTAADGRLDLALARWPEVLTIEARGYRPLRYEPELGGAPEDVLFVEALR